MNLNAASSSAATASPPLDGASATSDNSTQRSQRANDIVGGLTTFFTMAYIIVVNPLILSASVGDQSTGIAFTGALTATILLCFSMTLLMGVYAKLPFAVAPGMGINAFFAYTVILGYGVPWQTALAMVFWAGALFILISATPIRVTIAKAIPKPLRIATAAGIGLFLTFIGLKNAGLVVGDPVTLVKMGPLNAEALLALSGIAITAWLMLKRSPFAFLGGIFTVTGLALLFGMVDMPKKLFSTPDFDSAFLRLDLLGALKLSLLPTIFAIFFTDLFDSISTFIGVSHATGLVDEHGDPRNLKQGLVVDALATLGAGLVGTSSGTAYIESAAGIEAGGRTGFASVVTALCFLPFLFIAPLAAMVPIYATAPVLILLGVIMFRSIRDLEFVQLEKAIPCFLTIVLIPLTFSITQGILWGFISYVGLHLLVGKRREIHPAMFAITALSVLLLVIEQLGH